MLVMEVSPSFWLPQEHYLVALNWCARTPCQIRQTPSFWKQSSEHFFPYSFQLFFSYS